MPKKEKAREKREGLETMLRVPEEVWTEQRGQQRLGGWNGLSWKSHENRLGRCAVRRWPQDKGTVIPWAALG